MKIKKILATVFGIFLVSIIVGIGYSQVIKADAISGWLWSGTQSDGPIVNNTGFGWGSANGIDTGSSINYNVDIPLADGSVTGYAWSDNVGWIDFNPAGPFPASPSHSVEREGDLLTGWARISGIAGESSVGNSGGWLGWIKLKGDTQSAAPYGVDLHSIGNGTNDTGDYAWSDELGWISFEDVVLPNVPQLAVCIDSGEDLNITLIDPVDSSVDLGSHYANVFFQLNCLSKTEDWVDQVDAASTWTSSDSTVATVDNNSGIVTASATAVLGDTSTIQAAYLGLTADVEVCVYDCSCAESISKTETCDGGCGVVCDGEYALGVNWKEI